MFTNSISLCLRGDALLTHEGKTYPVQFKLDGTQPHVRLSDSNFGASATMPSRAAIEGPAAVLASVREVGFVTLAMFDAILDLPVVGMSGDDLVVDSMPIVGTIARNT